MSQLELELISLWFISPQGAFVKFGVPNANPSTKFDVKSALKHGLAFGTPKIYTAPYDKITHRLVNFSSNCDVKRRS